MFSDIQRNYEMLKGAYLRLKSYYHYNKNYIFMKEKIATFEENRDQMEATLSLIANVIMSPEMYSEVINDWVKQIDYYVIPKSFRPSQNKSGNSSKNEIFVSGADRTDEVVDKVNFFINMPFELYLLDSLWCMLLGKLVYDNGVINRNCYGNCIDNYGNYFEEKGDLFEGVKLNRNKLFIPYFRQYCKWKNGAIKATKQKQNSKNMAMVTLDIQGFYYAVRWRFDMLPGLLNDDNRLSSLSNLTTIVESIYSRYTEIISSVRVLEESETTDSMILPIGLFSSMLLSNMYLSDYDKNALKNDRILYYGRYVDDIIVVIDTKDQLLQGENYEFEDLLVDANNLLEKQDESFTLKGYDTLRIQREKVKIIFFEKKKSSGLIKALESTRIVPSATNIIPQSDFNLEDFEEAVYAIKNFTQDTKIRDIAQQEVDRYKLGWHMSQVVFSSRGERTQMTHKEKVKQGKESNNILRFFKGSNALNYHTNWINCFYFFLLSHEQNEWAVFRENIEKAIEDLHISQIEFIVQGRGTHIKNRIKRDMRDLLRISMSTALALSPCFVQGEDDQVYALAKMLRHANLFNHKLVNVPMANYWSDLPDYLDLTKIATNQIPTDDTILHGFKWDYSPRFVNMDELFYFSFVQDLTGEGNAFKTNGKILDDNAIDSIVDFFYKCNSIEKPQLRIDLSVDEEKIDDRYIIQKINVRNRKKGRIRSKIKIAIANVRLGLDECCEGLPGAREHVDQKKIELLNWFKEAYDNRVDYLLLPEFFLPYEWLPDVLSYVKRSGVSVVTGMKYYVDGVNAHNNVLFIPQFTSGGKHQYKNSCIFFREKNDYAPLEKTILSLHLLRCKDQQIPKYQIIDQNGVSFGIFLCYEFTDIFARALYKNKVDMLFTPEFNKDTGYFSNIIESLSRDLHAFVVQANTSIYGDSRITGPYKSKSRDIIQIKGGEQDSIIIGTINIGKLRKYQKAEEGILNGEIEKYLAMDSTKRYKELEKYRKADAEFSRTSARFKAR